MEELPRNLSKHMSSNFNLNLHHLLHQSSLAHGSCRSHFSEPLLQDWPAVCEIPPICEQIVHPHHIFHFRVCLVQRGMDVSEGLVALLYHVGGDLGGDIVVPIWPRVSDGS